MEDEHDAMFNCAKVYKPISTGNSAAAFTVGLILIICFTNAAEIKKLWLDSFALYCFYNQQYRLFIAVGAVVDTLFR